MEHSELRHLLHDLEIDYKDNRTNVKLIKELLQKDDYEGPETIYDIRLYYGIGLDRKDFEVLDMKELKKIVKTLKYEIMGDDREYYIKSVVNKLNEYRYEGPINAASIIKFIKSNKIIKVRPKYKNRPEKLIKPPKAEYRMCINIEQEV
jgi:hypothetical protein